MNVSRWREYLCRRGGRNSATVLPPGIAMKDADREEDWDMRWDRATLEAPVPSMDSLLPEAAVMDSPPGRPNKDYVSTAFQKPESLPVHIHDLQTLIFFQMLA
jgi:hypothetical protein